MTIQGDVKSISFCFILTTIFVKLLQIGNRVVLHNNLYFTNESIVLIENAFIYCYRYACCNESTVNIYNVESKKIERRGLEAGATSWRQWRVDDRFLETELAGRHKIR